MKVWTNRPATAEIEETVRRYFDLLRAGNLPAAAQLVDATDVRHVAKALWTGSVGAETDADGSDRSPASGTWEQDLSWLAELQAVDDLTWEPTGSRVSIRILHNGTVIEVELSFWVKPTDDGWVIAGPATLW